MKNYGFLPPTIDKTHYVLGGGNVVQKILQPNGDWTDSLPTEEKQFSPKFETYNCTSFNTLNQIEQYMFKAFGITANYSDRWLGIIAETDPKQGGNDPQKIYEAIRKYGLIPEEMLPFTDDIETVEEYYSFKNADRNACFVEGKKWLEQFDFKHEWVFQPEQPIDEKINNMKIALKYSPLAISVYAWTQNDLGIYISGGTPNHWTSEYLFDEENIQHIFDSYDPFKKMVDQNILYCKRIHIDKKEVKQKKSYWDYIIKFYRWFFTEKLIYRDFKKYLINYYNAKK